MTTFLNYAYMPNISYRITLPVPVLLNYFVNLANLLCLCAFFALVFDRKKSVCIILDFSQCAFLPTIFFFSFYLSLHLISLCMRCWHQVFHSLCLYACNIFFLFSSRLFVCFFKVHFEQVKLPKVFVLFGFFSVFTISSNFCHSDILCLVFCFFIFASFHPSPHCLHSNTISMCFVNKHSSVLLEIF